MPPVIVSGMATPKAASCARAFAHVSAPHSKVRLTTQQIFDPEPKWWSAPQTCEMRTRQSASHANLRVNFSQRMLPGFAGHRKVKLASFLHFALNPDTPLHQAHQPG